MTKVTIYKNQHGDVYGFKAKGHAANAPKGTCIYCAAISAITQTACIGIEEVAKANPQIEISDGSLSAFVSQTQAKTTECRTIFKTLILGLTSFDEGNPGYLQIFEEVQ